jgi:hypothetical protein
MLEELAVEPGGGAGQIAPGPLIDRRGGSVAVIIVGPISAAVAGIETAPSPQNLILRDDVVRGVVIIGHAAAERKPIIAATPAAGRSAIPGSYPDGWVCCRVTRLVSEDVIDDGVVAGRHVANYPSLAAVPIKIDPPVSKVVKAIPDDGVEA